MRRIIEITPARLYGLRVRSRSLSSERGVATIWIFLILAIVTAVVVAMVWRSLPPAEKSQAVAKTYHEPQPAPVTPPSTLAPTPEPPAAHLSPPAVTPSPTPSETLQLSELARHPEQWPREVTLHEPVWFPAVEGDRTVGVANTPPGTTVKLTKVLEDHIEVEFHGARTPVAAAVTDLEQRVKVLRQLALTRPSPSPTPQVLPKLMARERAPPPAKVERLKILTWNLEWFPGGHENATADQAEQHMENAKRALRRIDPDVLLLQEVRDLNAVEELVRDIRGYQVHIVSRFLREGEISRQQIAIASRLPADAAYAREWDQRKMLVPRGFAFAALKIGFSKYLLVYSVHLKSNHGEATENIPMREESARQLAAHTKMVLQDYERKSTGAALVVGGDFNLLERAEFKNEQTNSILRDNGLRWVWEGIPLEKRITWKARGDFEGACFDQFFVGGTINAKPEIQHFTGVSDHLPVLLTVEIK
jgi:endonuclease/exonuclease/phosphatase family metal-dependent hydrolase